MINENLAVTRGTGGFSHEFDFAASTPTKTIVAGEQWMLQLMDKVTPLLYKNNDVVDGGGDGQILLDTADDIVTVYLSEKEKNELPDSGYSYKLFWFNDETEEWETEAYGDITVSGLAATDTVVASVPWVNGNNIRETTQSTSIKPADDMVIGIPPNLAAIDFTLYEANTIIGKEWEFRNSGQGDINIKKPDASTLITLNPGESVKVKAVGKTANDHQTFYA